MPKRCNVLLLLGGAARLALVLASHDMGADDAPIRTSYPAGALVDELQHHGDSGGSCYAMAIQFLLPVSGFRCYHRR